MTTTAALVSNPTTDELAGAVLRRLEEAWNRGDGEAFGEAYTDDATFVTIRGERLHGRTQIAGGHAGIFATIYAGSTNRMELIHTRQLAENVILATSTGTLDAPQGPLHGVHTAMSTNVIIRSESQWLIAATHNTLIVKS